MTWPDDAFPPCEPFDVDRERLSYAVGLLCMAWDCDAVLEWHPVIANAMAAVEASGHPLAKVKPA